MRNLSKEVVMPSTTCAVLVRSRFMLSKFEAKEMVEPGLFDIMVGPDSERLQTVTLEIV